MTFRIGFDIDGVLADFTTAYNNLLKDVSGKPHAGLKPGEEPLCWFWATEYGFTKEDDVKAWEAIKRDPLFWYRLRPYLETPHALGVLQQMYIAGHEIYFITQRPGIHPHLQTVQWLINHGIATPQVLCQPKKADKGPLARSLDITHFIDDKPENCFEVKEASPATEVFILRKPYNSTPEYDSRVVALGIHIIPTIREFFLFLDAEVKAHAIVV